MDCVSISRVAKRDEDQRLPCYDTVKRQYSYDIQDKKKKEIHVVFMFL